MTLESEREVYCIGETVLDILFSDDKPVAAKPGGSLMNAAVSLARAGIRVQLISELFRDDPGRMILQFLAENGVSTDYAMQYNEGNTPIALAFLDKAAQTNYTFYKFFPEERMNRELPLPGPDAIVLFGSFYAISPEIRNTLSKFLENARINNSILIYDPNFRKSHLKNLPGLMPLILENISSSDIIRGSDEDFLHIFASKNPDNVFRQVQACGCNNLIYTRGGKDVIIFADDQQFIVPVPPIEPVSTIGAGDSFNAGLIYGLIDRDITKKGKLQMDEISWRSLLKYGISFSQDVCLGFDNYITGNFAQSLK